MASQAATSEATPRRWSHAPFYHVCISALNSWQVIYFSILLLFGFSIFMFGGLWISGGLEIYDY